MEAKMTEKIKEINISNLLTKFILVWYVIIGKVWLGGLIKIRN